MPRIPPSPPPPAICVHASSGPTLSTRSTDIGAQDSDTISPTGGTRWSGAEAPRRVQWMLGPSGSNWALDEHELNEEVSVDSNETAGLHGSDIEKYTKHQSEKSIKSRRGVFSPALHAWMSTEACTEPLCVGI
ncbi:hypothetical protein C8Q76DRAFT_799169 [Earliella scabrosa]|nr:hypothetical protein C8Q76DRAFT_799169 [Earliella scabrosa]